MRQPMLCTQSVFESHNLDIYSNSPNDSVACLLAQKTAANTAGYCAHETTLALLWVVWVTGVLGVAVWVGGVGCSL